MAIPWQDHLIQEHILDLSDYIEDEARIVPKTSFLKSIGPSIWLIDDDDHDQSTEMTTTTTTPTNNNKNNNSPDVIQEQDHEMTISSWMNNSLRFTSSTISSQVGPGLTWKSQACGMTHTVVVGLRGGGGAWVWNPQGPLTEDLKVEIQARCGGVRHLMVPNKYHVGRQLKEWSKAYPNAKVYAPPDFDLDQYIATHESKDSDKGVLTFDFFLTEDPKRDYVLDIDQVIFRGSSTDEVVFFHRLSQTIIFGDLLQQRPKPSTSNSSSWWKQMTEIVAPVPDGAPSSPPSEASEYFTPYTWQLSFWWKGEQELARKALNVILQKWKPTQVVIAQGDIIHGNAMETIQQVFSWVPEYAAYDTEIPVSKESLGKIVRETFSTGHGDVEVPEQPVDNMSTVEEQDGFRKTSTGMPLPRSSEEMAHPLVGTLDSTPKSTTESAATKAELIGDVMATGEISEERLLVPNANPKCDTSEKMENDETISQGEILKPEFFG